MATPTSVSATSCAASLAVLNVIEEEDLITRVNESGDRLQRLLRDALGNHPHVGDLRGRGMLLGVELVEDKSTKQPVSVTLGLPPKIKNAAIENGLDLLPRRRNG